MIPEHHYGQERNYREPLPVQISYFAILEVGCIRWNFKGRFTNNRQLRFTLAIHWW